MRSHEAVSAPALSLERRREVLLSTVALQRFALRGDIGSLRASLRASAWRWPLALGAAGVAARWLLVRRRPRVLAAGAIRWLPFALRCCMLLLRR